MCELKLYSENMEFNLLKDKMGDVIDALSVSNIAITPEEFEELDNLAYTIQSLVYGLTVEKSASK